MFHDLPAVLRAAITKKLHAGDFVGAKTLYDGYVATQTEWCSEHSTQSEPVTTFLPH